MNTPIIFKFNKFKWINVLFWKRRFIAIRSCTYIMYIVTWLRGDAIPTLTDRHCHILHDNISCRKFQNNELIRYTFTSLFTNANYFRHIDKDSYEDRNFRYKSSRLKTDSRPEDKQSTSILTNWPLSWSLITSL